MKNQVVVYFLFFIPLHTIGQIINLSGKYSSKTNEPGVCISFSKDNNFQFTNWYQYNNKAIGNGSYKIQNDTLILFFDIDTTIKPNFIEVIESFPTLTDSVTFVLQLSSSTKNIVGNLGLAKVKIGKTKNHVEYNPTYAFQLDFDGKGKITIPKMDSSYFLIVTYNNTSNILELNGNNNYSILGKFYLKDYWEISDTKLIYKIIRKNRRVLVLNEIDVAIPFKKYTISPARNSINNISIVTLKLKKMHNYR